MKTKIFLGDCRNEFLIEELFDSVSEFARLIEENGNSFTFQNIQVDYDETNDIHSFYQIT